MWFVFRRLFSLVKMKVITAKLKVRKIGVVMERVRDKHVGSFEVPTSKAHQGQVPSGEKDGHHGSAATSGQENSPAGR